MPGSDDWIKELGFDNSHGIPTYTPIRSKEEILEKL
jgi:hypothetical protein